MQVDSDFTVKLKNMDLVCLTLFAISIEFQAKSIKLIPEVQYDNNSVKYQVKKQYFIKPKFGPDVIKNDTTRANIDLSQFDAEIDLGEKPIPIIPCKIDKITLIEYM